MTMAMDRAQYHAPAPAQPLNWHAAADSARATWRGAHTVWLSTDGMRVELENGARIVIAAVRTHWDRAQVSYLAAYYPAGLRETSDEATFGCLADAMEYGRIVAAS